MPENEQKHETRRHEQEEYLGTGVDIFRLDPWSPNFKTRILQDPITQETPVARAQYREIYGDNLLKIGHEIAVEAGLKGGYAGVTASVKSKFKRSEQRTEKRHFLKISFTHSGTRLVAEGGKDQMRAQLNDEFKDAITKGDADELIQEYGTHLVRKIVLGGRAEYFAQSSASSKMTSEEFEAAARAKYDSLGGAAGEDADSPTGSIEASAKGGTKDTTKTKDVVGSESIDTVGGTAASAMGIKSKKDWDAWATSIDNRPAFLGFEKDGLMPIWELAANNARRDEIYQAYLRKAAKEFAPEILSVTSDVSNHPDARLVVPEGYNLLCGGAVDNWRASGNLLTASFPEGDNTWRVSGKDHSHSDPASITAFALAVYDPDNIWDVKIFSKTSGPEVDPPVQEVSVSNDYVMIGGGAQVHWNGSGILLFESYPMDKTTWRAKAKAHFHPDRGTITTYAIGLKCNVAGVTVQSDIAMAKSSASGRPEATVAPHRGYRMVGGGSQIAFNGPGVLLYASYPNENNQWEGRGKDHQGPDKGILSVYCIGLKVET